MRTDAEVTRAANVTADITLRLVQAKRQRDRARDVACALEAQLAEIETLATSWEAFYASPVMRSAAKQVRAIVDGVT